MEIIVKQFLFATALFAPTSAALAAERGVDFAASCCSLAAACCEAVLACCG